MRGPWCLLGLVSLPCSTLVPNGSEANSQKTNGRAGIDSRESIALISPRVHQEALERLVHARAGLRIAQQPAHVMVAERERPQLERELLGIEVGAEVLLLHRQVRSFGQRGKPVALRFHQVVAQLAWLVV